MDDGSDIMVGVILYENGDKMKQLKVMKQLKAKIRTMKLRKEEDKDTFCYLLFLIISQKTKSVVSEQTEVKIMSPSI